jgi:hypothetical protein
MRYMGKRAASFARSRDLGLRGVTSDGHKYTCHECGSRWAPRERFAWWPVSVRWSFPDFFQGWFAHWGAEIGADAIEQRVFARFIRLGPIVLRFGWRDAWR